MKTPCVLLILCVIMVARTFSATAQRHPTYPYKCFISTKNTKLKKGYLYQVTDSTIQITKKAANLYLVDSQPSLLETIPLKDQLIKVRVRSRYSGVVGATVGFLVGVGTIALFFPMLPNDFETQLIAALIVSPITAIGLSAIGARVANATSRASYTHADRNNTDLENLRHFSFVNWLDRKTRILVPVPVTQD